MTSVLEIFIAALAVWGAYCLLDSFRAWLRQKSRPTDRPKTLQPEQTKEGSTDHGK